MIRYIIAGALLFLGFVIAFAPAGILERLLEENTQAELTDTRGTLWHGQAQLLVNKHHIGALSWDFAPLSLLGLAPRYDWQLTAEDKRMQGSAALSFAQAEAAAQGSLDADAINPTLRAYDIFIGGHFDVQPTHVAVLTENRVVTELDGALNWSGGLVRYTLSGIMRETTLPSMSAILSMNDSGMPQAVVYATGEQAPLMLVSLHDNGFAKVSITKLFTKLLGNPWPGSDPDHAVVIEVEEQIF
jgi:hypothetical protein